MGISSKTIEADATERFKQSLTRQGSPHAHSKLLVILPICQRLGASLGESGEATGTWHWPKRGPQQLELAHGREL